MCTLWVHTQQVIPDEVTHAPAFCWAMSIVMLVAGDELKSTQVAAGNPHW